jgi:hypothetical protein
VKPRKDLLNALFGTLKKEAAQRTKRTGLEEKVAALKAFMRPHQRRVEEDLSALIAVRSARQQGKSTGAMLLVVIRCLEHAGAQWVVIGLTKGSVRRIYWDVLRQLSEAFELGIKFQEQAFIASFPNGSKIHFFGADNIDEVEKLRGGRYHGAVVDECKSIAALTFKLLIEDILGPALKGQAGQLYLIGTPGDVLSGEFFLATCDEPVLLASKRWSNLPFGEKERDGHTGVWSFHHWGPRTNDVVFENPRTGQKFTMWDAFLEEKARRGWADDNSVWRREYLGEWVAGEGRLVYRYRPHLHDYQPIKENLWGLPEAKRWKTVCGFDFGTRDGTAIVVWAWSDDVAGLWEVYSEKRRNEADLRLSVKDLADWYKAVEAQYGPFEGVIGDRAGLATMVIDTLAVEHGVFVEPAEKKEKVDHIEVFNNDLDARQIHIRAGSELSEELMGNKWLEKSLGTERRLEDPSTPNDLCDAALYAFRWCMHRIRKERKEGGPAPMTAEWYQQLAKQELTQRREKAREKANNSGLLDRDWWTD